MGSVLFVICVACTCSIQIADSVIILHQIQRTLPLFPAC